MTASTFPPVKLLPVRLMLMGLLWSLPLLAQVNTETMRQENLTSGTHCTLGATLSYLEGNSKVFQSRLQARLDQVQPWGRLFLVGNQKLSSKDEKLFINQGFMHLRVVKPMSARLEAEFFLQQEYNEFIHLTSRSLGGCGFRYKLVDRPGSRQASQPFRITLGMGLMLEQERIDTGSEGLGGDPIHGNQANLLRSTNYAVINWTPSVRVTFQSTTYYQVDTQRLADYRILTKSQLNLKFTQSLSLNFELNLRYDSEPPVGIEDLDLEFSQGLTYRFN